jgi:hypothetical protein
MEERTMAKWTPLLAIVAAITLLGATGASASEFSKDPENSGEAVYHSADIPITLIQNTSLAVVAGNAVSCNTNRRHANNGYLRRFSLDGDYGLLKKYVVTNVTFGVEFADAGTATQPVMVNLYSIPTGELLQYANLTLIGSETIQLEDQELTLVNVPVTGVVDDANIHDLVVEVFTPNGQAQGHIFFMGSNSLGQTGASYLAAADCGAPEPRTTFSLGAPQMHIVLAVSGSGETQTLAGTWGKVKATYR